MPDTKSQTESAGRMLPRDFNRTRQMVYDFCGVELAGKEVLVASRLGKKLRELGLDSFEAYLQYVHRDASGDAFTAMIDALTTNHTSFLRENRHFEFLTKQLVPRLSASARLRLWSAACSTGEEPYSIAFSLVAAIGPAAFTRVAITATDVSTRVLKFAEEGIYTKEAIKDLPPEMVRACLLKGVGTYSDRCRIKEEVRNLVEFRPLNLMQGCSSVGPFEVIFCRNVMIYFDRQTQQKVVGHLIDRLVPGGHLFIGHAESLNGIRHSLRYICPAIYQKVIDAPKEAALDRSLSIRKAQ